MAEMVLGFWLQVIGSNGVVVHRWAFFSRTLHLSVSFFSLSSLFILLLFFSSPNHRERRGGAALEVRRGWAWVELGFDGG